MSDDERPYEIVRRGSIGTGRLFPIADMRVGDYIEFDPSDLERAEILAASYGGRGTRRFMVNEVTSRLLRVG
jgi:hypothetical protein